jgi:leucine zipper transcription factor-like protein 1
MSDTEIQALVEGLSPASRDFLQKYFFWAKKKRSLHVKDIEGEIYEYKTVSLLDDTYNKADVIDILNGLLAILKVTVEKDQKDTTHTFGEILRQALLQADKGGVEIHPDIECLDNVGLIATIGLLEKNVTEGKGALGPIGGGVPKPKPGAMPLAPISAAPVAPAGPSEKELELEAENKRIQEKLQKIQQQYTTMMQEKTKLSQELASIKDSTEATAANASARALALEKEKEELKAAIERKDAEIESGQKQLTGKLADSSQFKTLKKLLNQKTQQVKELRTKLEKYEPDGEGSTIELQEESSSDDDE